MRHTYTDVDGELAKWATLSYRSKQMEPAMIDRQETTRSPVANLLSELMVLFKARIVVLLLAAALAGAFIGARGRPSGADLWLILVTGALSAMGASALNEYIERDKDRLMARTRRRPLVAGTLAGAAWVPWVAVAMIVAPVLAVLPSNPAMALSLALGAIIYVVIYTLWLKPRTSLNIVVGGLAGSCAVLGGGAAVHAWSDPVVLGLALLLFFWTPIHFWALAIVYREDYARAGVPMLPVVAAPRVAAAWGLVHGVAAALTGLALALTSTLGYFYMVPVLVSSAFLLAQGIGLVVMPSKRRAWHLFHTSNAFLAVVLLASIAGSIVAAAAS